MLGFFSPNVEHLDKHSKFKPLKWETNNEIPNKDLTKSVNEGHKHLIKQSTNVMNIKISQMSKQLIFLSTKNPKKIFQ